MKSFCCCGKQLLYATHERVQAYRASQAQHGKRLEQFRSSLLPAHSGMSCAGESTACIANHESDFGTKGTSNRTVVAVQDNLFLWSWFIVLGIVLAGLVSNLIVIHAICFVKRFHRFV